MGKSHGFIILGILAGYMLNLYIGMTTGAMAVKKKYVMLTTPRSIHGLACFSKDTRIIAGICEPADSEIIVEINNYAKFFVKAEKGKWQIELTEVPNTLFKLRVRLASHPHISETSWMVYYIDHLLAVKEIGERESFIEFTIHVPKDYLGETVFQLVGLGEDRTVTIQDLLPEELKYHHFKVKKEKLDEGENILVLVIKMRKRNIYSPPISVDNVETLSNKDIEESERIGKLVRDFFHRECSDLPIHKAGEKIVALLKKQEGVKNILFKDLQISWETAAGIGMTFSLTSSEKNN